MLDYIERSHFPRDVLNEFVYQRVTSESKAPIDRLYNNLTHLASITHAEDSIPLRVGNAARLPDPRFRIFALLPRTVWHTRRSNKLVRSAAAFDSNGLMLAVGALTRAVTSHPLFDDLLRIADAAIMCNVEARSFFLAIGADDPALEEVVTNNHVPPQRTAEAAIAANDDDESTDSNNNNKSSETESDIESTSSSDSDNVHVVVTREVAKRRRKASREQQ